MALELIKPADRTFLKALFFAPGGHGKTHLLGTAQEDGRTSPMLLLDFESGLETLAGLDIDVVEIRDWGDYSEVYEALVEGDDTSWKSLGMSEQPKSVGLDSISETHIWALLSRVAEKGPSRKEPDLVEQGDYGVVTTQMRRLLREFRDLPMHVFYTAAAKDIDERGVGKVKVPALAGQMADEVVLLPSLSGYLAKSMDDEGEEERVLLLQNYPGFRTKVRSAWQATAPDEIINPTVTSILDALDITGAPKRRARKKKED